MEIQIQQNELLQSLATEIGALKVNESISNLQRAALEKKIEELEPLVEGLKNRVLELTEANQEMRAKFPPFQEKHTQRSRKKLALVPQPESTE